MEKIVDGGHSLVHQLVQLGGGGGVSSLQVHKRILIEVLSYWNLCSVP